MGLKLDEWIEKVKRCEYLMEEDLKSLCDFVSKQREVVFTVIYKLYYIKNHIYIYMDYK